MNIPRNINMASHFMLPYDRPTYRPRITQPIPLACVNFARK